MSWKDVQVSLLVVLHALTTCDLPNPYQNMYHAGQRFRMPLPWESAKSRAFVTEYRWER